LPFNGESEVLPDDPLDLGSRRFLHV
jgi:hypothetical protein